MSAEKRESVRAIIFSGDSIVSMYREKDGRSYYTFPGGGKEKTESEVECVTREVKEEFGLEVLPTKKVYVYENEKVINHFYVCKWISGKIGSGKGEEFQPDRNKGQYKQTKIKISKIASLPLMPPEVASQFVKDFERNGENLRSKVLKIDGHV